MKKKPSARETLKTPCESRGGARSSVTRWFRNHDEGRELVDAWIDMASRGETDWTVRRLQDELIREHDFPFEDGSTLTRWLRRNYGPLYDAALGR